MNTGINVERKTTLLGLLLEEILLKIQNAKIVILDLNSDFSEFDQMRPEKVVNSSNHPCEEIDGGALKAASKQLRSVKKNLIFSPVIRMNRYDRSDLLQLENIPYNFSTEDWLEEVYNQLSKSGSVSPSPKMCEELLRKQMEQGKSSALIGKDVTYPLRDEDLSGHAILHDFFRRIKDWPIWSADNADSLDELESGFRFVEFNLGGLRFAHTAILSEAVLKRLWEINEKSRDPTFVIIDEAHNLAPAVPEETWQKRTLEWVNRISGEGRKYGLYLILVSQRPAKIHPNCLDNCKNFFILRLENGDDLESLSRRTMEVSESLLSRAATFRRHEALLFGDLGPPAIIRPGRRRIK